MRGYGHRDRDDDWRRDDRGGGGRYGGGGGGRNGGGGGRRRGRDYGGGAARAAEVIGTEDDKVNCPFYYKIGACRHGERCSRVHIKPAFSQTVLVPHMYVRPPPGNDGLPVDDTDHFENFYEEILDEMSNYGPIEELNVLENMGDHLVGNVYVKYTNEEGGSKACGELRGRYYGGNMLMPELSLVTNFREARCRQYDEAQCARGDYCNFMHIRRTSKHLRKKLRKLRRKAEERERSESRSRSRSRRRRRRDRSRSRDRDRDRRRGRKQHDNEVARASNSEERRNMIAMWNTKKKDDGDEKKDEGKEIPPSEPKTETKDEAKSDANGTGEAKAEEPAAPEEKEAPPPTAEPTPAPEEKAAPAP